MEKFIFSAAFLTAVLASAQNTGIGTTAPRAKLDVIGGVRASKGTPKDDASNFGYSFESDGDTGIFAVGGNASMSSDIIIYNDAVPHFIVRPSSVVGINTAVPDNSAQLDIVSSNRGALLPRIALISTSSAVPTTNPALGLTVFNTATANDVLPGYYYWDSAKWVRLADAKGGLNAYQGSTSVALNGSSFERAALTGDITASQNSNTTTISANAVTSAKIADGTIAAADLSAMGATTGQVMKWNGTQWVAAADVDTNTTYTGSTTVSLNGTSFERAALTGDVTSAQNSNATIIAPNAVTSAKIADGTIAAADLSAMGATAAGQNLTWNGTAWVPTAPAAIPAEPWNIIGGTNPATSNSQNIYQSGSVSVGTNSNWGTGLNSAGVRSAKGEPGNDASKTGYAFDVDGDTGMFALGGQPGVGSDISFYIDNQKKVTIKNSGNVGIGNDAPEEKLDVTGNIKSSNLAGTGSRVVVADDKGVLKIGSVANTPNIYTTDGTLQAARKVSLNGNNLNFAGNGNVAVGDIAPQAKFDVQGNIRIADGTQGAGKFLMSDNNGIAQWAVPATTYQNYVGIFPNKNLIYPSSTISTADNFYSKTSFSITLAPGQYQVFVNGAASMFPESGNPITGYTTPYTTDNRLTNVDDGIRFRAVFSTLTADHIGLNNAGGAVQEDSSAGTTNISYPFDQNQISFSTVIINSTTGNVTYNLFVKAYKRGINDKYIYDAFNGRWAEDKISAIRIGN